jgi:hypothetical protein
MYAAQITTSRARWLACPVSPIDAKISARVSGGTGFIFKKLARAYVRFVQKVALNVLLTGLYFFGFGPSHVLARTLRLSVIRRDRDQARFWLPAEDYDADLTNSVEQS